MLTKEDIEAIGLLLDKKLEPIIEKLDQHTEQLKEIDDSIGMIADWAEKVADKERIPFASGN